MVVGSRLFLVEEVYYVSTEMIVNMAAIYA